MRDERLKHIKEVKGWKVNHPFSGGNIFFMILILLSIGTFAAIFFMPLLSFQDRPEQYFNGLDLVKFFFFDQMNITNTAMSRIGTIGTTSVELQDIIAFIFMGQSIGIATLAFFTLIELLYFIVNLFKGYIRGAGFVKALMIFKFIIFIIFGLSFVSFDIMDKYFNNGNNQIVYFWAFISPGALLIILISAGITYSLTYKDVVFEKDLMIKNKPEQEKKDEENKDNQEGNDESSDIPQDLMEIGDHAFSENQKLVNVNIPNAIFTIGASAFANCLNLKSVTIPSGIIEIGFNCFFHCVELNTINFMGTVEEWNKIKRGSNWSAQTKLEEINCKDGVAKVNPFN